MQLRSGEGLGSWKLAATSVHGQRHVDVDGPMAGRILANRIVPPGSTILLAGNIMRVVEPEFAFVLGRDLPPRATPWTRTELLDAVTALRLALEVPDSRYADFVHAGEAQLVAESACAHDLVLGPVVTADWRSLDLSGHSVRAEVVGRYRRQGTGAAVLGDPRIALLWWANELSTIRETARAGQVVITGTCMKSLEIQEGDHVRVDYGVLGSIEARFR
jgi:2-keto-4-pentenoate hydratase